MRACAFRRHLRWPGVPDFNSDSYSFRYPKFAKTGEVLTSPYLSGGTPHSAGPAQNPQNLHFWRQNIGFFRILDRLFADPKNIKNRAPSKTSKIRKNPPPERQNTGFSCFLMTLGVSFFMNFLICSGFFKKSVDYADAFKQMKKQEKSWFGTSKIAHFGIGFA